MKIDLSGIATFGVAGNFTGHLEQAGEAKDFLKVEVAEKNAPKAIFPTFLPVKNENIPAFLGVFPFDEEKIVFPEKMSNLQIEPECGIVFDVEWKDDKVSSLKPVCFAASNDCSIRKQGAKKISEKKNWGKSSKGFSADAIEIDSFDEKGIISKYRIASFLLRDGTVHVYGEDSAIRDYSYIYEKLVLWMTDKFNTQKDSDPQENINLYLNSAGKPSTIMVSIGATRYTDFGEHNFLRNGDVSFVVLYPEDKYSHEDILKMAEKDSFHDEKISVLRQKIIF